MSNIEEMAYAIYSAASVHEGTYPLAWTELHSHWQEKYIKCANAAMNSLGPHVDQEVSDPLSFEHPTLLALHQAFLRAAGIMVDIGVKGKGYWDILHAAQSLLEAMNKVGDAAFEWQDYNGRDEVDA